MREEARVASRKRLSRDERRARILESAAKVFADRGYESATLDEIAEAAEISKPVIYDHFESKKDLHITLIDTHSRDLVEHMASRVAAEQVPDRQLYAGFDALLEFVERDPYAWRLFFREPAAADPEILEAYRRNQKRTSSAIAGLVAAHGISEQPGDMEADDLVGLVAEIMKWAGAGLVSWWYERRDVPREELVKAAMNALWIGLERTQSGERWPS